MSPLDGAASLAVRQSRAELRRRVKAVPNERGARDVGLALLADVLAERPACLDRTMLWDVLGWVPRITEANRRRIMRHADIHTDVRLVGELTDRQLGLLLNVLRSPILGAAAA